MSKTLKIQLPEEDLNLIEKYAKSSGLSASEYILQAVIERIEDDFDLELAKQALAEYEADPVTYTMDEAWEIILSDDEEETQE